MAIMDKAPPSRVCRGCLVRQDISRFSLLEHPMTKRQTMPRFTAHVFCQKCVNTYHRRRTLAVMFEVPQP